jgi:hypothetical protein
VGLLSAPMSARVAVRCKNLSLQPGAIAIPLAPGSCLSLWAGLDGGDGLTLVSSTADVVLSRPRRATDAAAASLHLEARAGGERGPIVCEADVLTGEWLWICATDFSVVSACVPLFDGRGKLTAKCVLEFVGGGGGGGTATVATGTAVRVLVDRARLDSVNILYVRARDGVHASCQPALRVRGSSSSSSSSSSAETVEWDCRVKVSCHPCIAPPAAGSLCPSMGITKLVEATTRAPAWGVDMTLAWDTTNEAVAAGGAVAAALAAAPVLPVLAARLVAPRLGTRSFGAGVGVVSSSALECELDTGTVLCGIDDPRCLSRRRSW